MGTISCPECKALFGKEHDCCPFCGFSRAGKILSVKKVFFSFLLGTITILLIVFMMPDAPSDQITALSLNKQKANTRWQEIDHSASAYTMASIYVKERLKFPGSAKFPTLLEGQANHVTNLGKQKYHIVSYVDMQDKTGSLVRIQFQGNIEQIREDEWMLISLDTQQANQELEFSMKVPSE